METYLGHAVWAYIDKSFKRNHTMSRIRFCVCPYMSRLSNTIMWLTLINTLLRNVMLNFHCFEFLSFATLLQETFYPNFIFQNMNLKMNYSPVEAMMLSQLMNWYLLYCQCKYGGIYRVESYSYNWSMAICTKYIRHCLGNCLTTICFCYYITWHN